MHLARLVLLVLCALPLAGGGGDDEIVKEFKRYFRKYKDSATRVEAVLALEGTDTTGVVQALVPVLKDSDVLVVNAAVRVLGGLESPGTVQAFLALLEDEKKLAIRLGLLRAVALGGFSGAEPILLPFLEAKEWEVRHHSIRALVRVHGERAAQAILPLCMDKQVELRVSALDGLAELGSELVIEPAIAQLEAKSWQVRASAIHALGRVRHKSAIEPLVVRMETEEGRLIQDAADALEAVTGLSFGLEPRDWRKFWTRSKERFEIPSAVEIARLKALRAKNERKYSPENAKASFHGLETPSQSIKFVIDVSGSMEQELSDRQLYNAADFPSLQRMEIVKSELIRTIEKMEPSVKFNLLAFATEVRQWKKRMVRANPLNKSSAISFLRRLEPIGGASKQHLAQAGLVGSANLRAGMTNTYGALMQALGVTGKGKTDASDVVVDTIYFLSDGQPSTGEFIDMGDILREVEAANEHRGVVIHTLGIGDFEAAFMKSLAQSSGGSFINLGK